ncbi:CRISPR system precrRNA processing endoribonuclease RAMP protein Cas6 [Acinetobacter modestus]|uniref:CRISPR system precrRNA processing endoribonuclease RAMP protein Cas6 n=1 Tax=Acinetobacter modestus TaxID=1776740 RepID=UPI00202F090B|nr:CRISPR system precrRNA processing endoribonuclease RAMP protein Cas6 [Acinetobacter modestus]
MSLKALQFQIHVKQEEDIILPAFSGSMLRGAFGHSLRKISCITRMPDCNLCPLKQNCSYIRIFETEKLFDDISQYGQAQNPYALQVAHLSNQKIEKGQGWSFSMTLVGKAIDDLPIVMFAWQKALERGLTHQRIMCTLVKISQGNATLYDPLINKFFPAYISEFNPVQTIQAKRLRLTFESPVRLKHNGQYILEGSKLHPQQILLRLYQRIQNYCRQHGEVMPIEFEQLKPALDEMQGQAIKLNKNQIIRFSNRQKQQIQLQGLIGTYELFGDLDPWLPLLEFGQTIHLGKNATHGLGQYKIEQVC